MCRLRPVADRRCCVKVLSVISAACLMVKFSGSRQIIKFIRRHLQPWCHRISFIFPIHVPQRGQRFGKAEISEASAKYEKIRHVLHTRDATNVGSVRRTPIAPERAGSSRVCLWRQGRTTDELGQKGGQLTNTMGSPTRVRTTEGLPLSSVTAVGRSASLRGHQICVKR